MLQENLTIRHGMATPDDGNTANDVNPNAGGHNLGLATINEAGIEAVVTVRNPADADFAQITNAFLCMETNGVSEIPEGTYSGVLSMTANMGFIAIPNVPFHWFNAGEKR